MARERPRATKDQGYKVRQYDSPGRSRGFPGRVLLMPRRRWASDTITRHTPSLSRFREIKHANFFSVTQSLSRLFPTLLAAAAVAPVSHLALAENVSRHPPRPKKDTLNAFSSGVRKKRPERLRSLALLNSCLRTPGWVMSDASLRTHHIGGSNTGSSDVRALAISASCPVVDLTPFRDTQARYL